MSVPSSASIARLSGPPGAAPSAATALGVATVEGRSHAASGHQIAIGRLAILTAQVALVALVIRQFEIESAAFLQLTVLTLVGFVVHALLPFRYRLPCFLALSLAGIGLVLGLQAGAVLVALGLMLIGICHLPGPFWVRVSLLMAVGAGLALMRVDLLVSPLRVPQLVWPILGSMFMFRLWVYMYDLKHDTGPQSPVRSLSYFFLLPNVCFPLFPVVDYKAYRRTYYNEEASAIYQNGVRWMFRGVVHLILYRLVYHHLTLTPAEVSTVPDLVQFVTSNFLLYLRVSGQFHLVVGMLHLFGFNLPPTHHLYYLAANINDFWRRINIYWKDFMMKLFYYPAYFKLRTLGATTALVLSTLFVFATTWLLHSYQWFWLRGSFPLNWQDGVFWAILAMLVVINSLYETKYGRARSIGARVWTPATLAVTSLKTLTTFSGMCVLWSLWTCESLSQWLSLWALPGGFGGLSAQAVAPVALLGMVWFGVAADRAPEGSGGKPGRARATSFGRQALLTTVSIVAVYIVGQPAVYSKLGAQGAIIESVRTSKLSARDAAQMDAGYYEGLLRLDRFNSQLWEVYMRNAQDMDDWGDAEAEVYSSTKDLLRKELRPNLHTRFRNRPFSTNQWSMRDDEYSELPAPGTRRIALLGSSTVMGASVGDGETFEALLEARLNAEHVSAASARYEILNFAVGSYGPLEQVVVVEKRVFRFRPEAVFFIAHYHDGERAIERLARAVIKRFELPYEELRRIAREAGVDSSMSETVVRRRLAPFRNALVSFAYRHIAADCRARGVKPVWIFVPALADRTIGQRSDELIGLAKDAGFVALDLSDAYAGHDTNLLKISEADNHPNPAGHKLLAERFYRALTELDRDASLGLLTNPSGALRQE